MNEQLRHYERKVAFETDSWDVKTALESGQNIVVIDARSPEVYQREHIPGAINIPHRKMGEETTNTSIRQFWSVPTAMALAAMHQPRAR